MQVKRYTALAFLYVCGFFFQVFVFEVAGVVFDTPFGRLGELTGKTQNGVVVVIGVWVIGQAQEIVGGHMEVPGNSDLNGVGWFALFPLIRRNGVFVDF